MKNHAVSTFTHIFSERLTETYLCVSVEHFDSLGRNEQIHLCHWLRLSLRSLREHRDSLISDVLTCSDDSNPLS